MERKRDGLVPIREVFAAQARHHYTQADQVDQLVEAIGVPRRQARFFAEWVTGAILSLVGRVISNWKNTAIYGVISIEQM